MTEELNNPSQPPRPGGGAPDGLTSGGADAPDGGAFRAGDDEGEPAMASEAVARLFDALSGAPWKFDFFTALRRIENLFPDKARFGYSKHFHQDPIRLGQETSMAFAPSTLASFARVPEPPLVRGADRATDRPPPPAWRLMVHFFGLCGANGPLPLHLTEYVRDRLRNAGDPTAARFFDVFHHRLLSLFYRAWATAQQAVNFERSLGDDPTDRNPRADGDRFAVYVASLFGLGTPALRGRDSAPDLAKLHYAGRLSNQARNAQGLQAILSHYFGMPVTIEEFVGQWVTLPRESTCRLGESPETGLLGQTTIVGSKVWDCQQRFRVRMGPMGFEQYQRLVPAGKISEWFERHALPAWVRNYVGDELSWEVQLVLKKEEVPQAQLGALGQLGRSAWMGNLPRAKDAEDLRLRPEAG